MVMTHAVSTAENSYFPAGTSNTNQVDGQQVVVAENEQFEFSNDETESQQQIEVNGSVVDINGMPLPGVTVIVKGTTIGTVTNPDGEFTLRIAAESEVLQFSFVGMQTQDIPIDGRTTFKVVMEETSIGLEEVVAVGYGVQRKESVVGAISQIGTESLTMAGTDNITNAIAGKLSGVLTIQDTGEPGANHSEIVIRGLSSWSGSAPLVMVDGVERDFRYLDPNEIESISVLKDASATAVFGAKGANGVILVTTRRGSKQKPKLSFKGSTGIQKASGMDYFVDSYTTMSMLQVTRMNDQRFEERLPDNVLNEYRQPSSRLNALRYPNVNWFDEVTRPFAPISNANLNINGGTDFVKYFASLGYQYEGGIFLGMNEGHIDSRHKNNRLNYRANLDFALTKTTNLTFNLGGDISAKNNPATNTWYALANTGPARFPAYFPEWVLEEVPDPHYPDAKGKRLSKAFGERYENPYSFYNDGAFRNYTSSRVFSDLIFGQDLDFLVKGLSVNGKVSLNTYYNMLTKYSDTRMPQYYLHFDLIGTDQNPWERVDETLAVYNPPPINVNTGALQGGTRADGGYYTEIYYEGSISYNNSFGDGKHNVTGLALVNRHQKNDELAFPYYNEAWVGRATYNYMYKYLFEVNMGYTGSERFSPNNRFGFFPSGAVGWVVSEEKFFQNAVPWMSTLKLRYSDGLVGSDHAENRWLYISEFYTTGNYIAEDIGANVNAQWEEARKRDIGLEIGLLDNRFRFNIDLYDEYRTKMLTEPQNVTFLVGNSFKDLNLGELKKHGFEIEAEYNSKTEGNFNYYVKGMLGFNENRIIFRDDLLYAPDYRKYAGKQLGMPEGWNVPLGIPTGAAGVLLINSEYLTTVDDIHNHATQIPPNQLNVGDHVFLDYDVDGSITSRDKYPIEGSQYPPITYSFSGGLKYKGWGLNFMFQGNKGKWVVFNNVFENEFELGSWSVRPTQLNYWRPDRQAEADHATLHYFDGGGGIPQYAWAGGAGLEGYDLRTPGHFWRNADYLRLKEVHLEYNINQSGRIGTFTRNIGIADLTIYAQGYNLLTFTDLILGDPEKREFTRGSYPLMKTVRIGIAASFN
ncbi:MAG TPA: TonB-dependent receptor [Mariniphaga sp.]|nr:TonB-dependent receptor [Mariniphaga sp.]